MKWLATLFVKFGDKMSLIGSDLDDQPIPGRWYNAGLERTCAMLEDAGYRIIDPDVGSLHRDPIIHFVKP
jgi:hypothetical protein